MNANHELFSFPFGVTSSNKKRGSSDELGKKSSFKKINCVLKVENMPKEINYIMAMDVFVAFGRIERIKKVWQAHNKTNTFYLF